MRHMQTAFHAVNSGGRWCKPTFIAHHRSHYRQPDFHVEVQPVIGSMFKNPAAGQQEIWHGNP